MFYVIVIKNFSSKVHLSQKALIWAIINKTVVFPKDYKNFETVFSVKNAGYLPLHKYHNNAIDLIDGKKFLYKPIYSLSKNELLILLAYIYKNLTNTFIRPFKFSFGSFILFMSKPNKGLWLCVDYWGLNNITIKNWYLFLLVSKYLDRLGQVKQFTKLDFTDTYYQILIKKTTNRKPHFELDKASTSIASDYLR